LVVPRRRLTDLIICWAWKPDQQPSDWVNLPAVGVVGGHVGAHDAGHGAGDVQVGREGVLQLQLDDVVDRDAARRQPLG
jgi:hypothetical protein